MGKNNLTKYEKLILQVDACTTAHSAHIMLEARANSFASILIRSKSSELHTSLLFVFVVVSLSVAQ